MNKKKWLCLKIYPEIISKSKNVYVKIKNKRVFGPEGQRQVYFF